MKLKKTNYLTGQEGPLLLRYIKKAGNIFNKAEKLLNQSNYGEIKLNANAIDDLIKIRTESHLIHADLLYNYFQKTPEEIGFKKITYCQHINQLHKSKTRHSITCAVTKAGTDDPDCTCGFQEVLDDQARDLAEENQPDDETENCIEEESND